MPLADLAAKRVQLMKELSPDIDSVAIIFNPRVSTARSQAHSAEVAARGLGIVPHSAPLASKDESEIVIETIVARRIKSAIIVPTR